MLSLCVFLCVWHSIYCNWVFAMKIDCWILTEKFTRIASNKKKEAKEREKYKAYVHHLVLFYSTDFIIHILCWIIHKRRMFLWLIKTSHSCYPFPKAFHYNNKVRFGRFNFFVICYISIVLLNIKHGVLRLMWVNISCHF